MCVSLSVEFLLPMTPQFSNQDPQHGQVLNQDPLDPQFSNQIYVSAQSTYVQREMTSKVSRTKTNYSGTESEA